MTHGKSDFQGSDKEQADRPELSPEARRALKEAEERRESLERAESERAGENEVGGRDGPDPTRYGDWEKDGIVSDF